MHARKMHALEMHAQETHAHQIHPHETPAHQMHARGMHAREVQINHKRPHMRNCLPKKGWESLQVPYLMNGGRFVETRVAKYQFYRWMPVVPIARRSRAVLRCDRSTNLADSLFRVIYRFGVPLLNGQRAPPMRRLYMFSTMLSRELSFWESSQPNMLGEHIFHLPEGLTA
jgi:hypothetical protein